MSSYMPYSAELAAVRALYEAGKTIGRASERIARLMSDAKKAGNDLITSFRDFSAASPTERQMEMAAASAKISAHNIADVIEAMEQAIDDALKISARLNELAEQLSSPCPGPTIKSLRRGYSSHKERNQ